MPLVLAAVLLAVAPPSPTSSGTPPSPPSHPSPAAGGGNGWGLPPPEALEEYPGYERWRMLEMKIGEGGEMATIRLRHPEAPRVIAVLHYRLVSSAVFESEP